MEQNIFLKKIDEAEQELKSKLEFFKELKEYVKINPDCLENKYSKIFNSDIEKDIPIEDMEFNLSHIQENEKLLNVFSSFINDFTIKAKGVNQDGKSGEWSNEITHKAVNFKDFVKLYRVNTIKGTIKENE